MLHDGDGIVCTYCSVDVICIASLSTMEHLRAHIARGWVVGVALDGHVARPPEKAMVIVTIGGIGAVRAGVGRVDEGHRQRVGRGVVMEEVVAIHSIHCAHSVECIHRTQSVVGMRH